VSSSRQGDNPTARSRARRVTLALAAAAAATALTFAASCSDPEPPTGPSVSTTAAPTTTTTTAPTTTTTTAATTTTTTGGTTTTTTTTTTTAPAIDYATQIHPQWDAQGCTQCHTAGHPSLDLDGPPAATCQAIADRDGTNVDLVITGGGAANSQLIRKPAALVAHAGGLIPCFAQGAACWNATLEWLQAGAPGPGGVTCDH